ncbi:MAG: ABC transporter ATP-binding protein [Nitrospirales bacterium]|nr:ABC transporter ATP-binding protein [Nitrospirales bacterium]
MNSPSSQTLRADASTQGASSAIAVHNLGMQLPAGQHLITILQTISFTIPTGQIVAIMGPSGSGKSTLLGLMAGLDRPTAGSIVIQGTDITTLNESEMARFRRSHIGYVFQAFHLIPTLTALENVLLPLELQGRSQGKDRAQALLQSVGLEHRLHHYPIQLSGGEQQRVALARAFISQPSILFADEPTGNLDSQTGERIIELLWQLHQEHGSTLVLVTHDPSLAKQAPRILTLRDGHLIADSDHHPETHFS